MSTPDSNHAETGENLAPSPAAEQGGSSGSIEEMLRGKDFNGALALLQQSTSTEVRCAYAKRLFAETMRAANPAGGNTRPLDISLAIRVTEAFAQDLGADTVGKYAIRFLHESRLKGGSPDIRLANDMLARFGSALSPEQRTEWEGHIAQAKKSLLK